MLGSLDGKLDMSLFVLLPIDGCDVPFLNYSENIPVDIHFHGDKMFFNYFVERNQSKVYDIYRDYNPVILGNWMMLSQRMDAPELKTIKRKISAIPTMVMGGLYRRGGQLALDFRFHISDLEKVEEFVKFIVSVDIDTTITRLGKSSGLKAVLDGIDKRAELTAIRFSYREKVKKRILSEWRGIPDPTSAVTFGLGRKGGVGRLDISGSPPTPLLRAILRDQIPLVGFFEDHNNGRVSSIALVPTFLTQAFLIRFFERMNKVEGLLLESVEKYEAVRDRL